jgi:hypothetical protein
MGWQGERMERRRGGGHQLARPCERAREVERERYGGS